MVRTIVLLSLPTLAVGAPADANISADPCSDYPEPGSGGGWCNGQNPGTPTCCWGWCAGGCWGNYFQPNSRATNHGCTLGTAPLCQKKGVDAVERRVRIDGRQFIVAETKDPIVLAGPNIVVKGPPYLPAVSGTEICNDFDGDNCAATGTCKSCTTFNQADVDHILGRGWNTIRLGVAWAGAQPRDEDALDPAFLERLHAILELTDKSGLHVILDNHGDMVGTANCGNGVPMWVQQKAAPDLIGKPLTTDFPYNAISSLEVTKLGGYERCGGDLEKWAKFAGDPNYNLLNECCQAMNSGGNPQQLGYTSLSQKTMDYIFTEGQGRQDFVRFWTLMTNEVTQHPSVISMELMNEPMSIWRYHYYETWRACAEAINNIIPDMSVALAEIGEGSGILPDWAVPIVGQWVDINPFTLAWIKSANTLYKAWHWYGTPSDWKEAVKTAEGYSSNWNIPHFATEFMSCDLWNGLADAGISRSYWHYSSYCTTGPNFGNRSVPEETFGACILGWGGGDSSKTCDRRTASVVV